MSTLTRTQNRYLKRYSQQADDLSVALTQFLILNTLSPVLTQELLDCIILAIRLEARINMLKYNADSALTVARQPDDNAGIADAKEILDENR